MCRVWFWYLVLNSIQKYNVCTMLKEEDDCIQVYVIVSVYWWCVVWQWFYSFVVVISLCLTTTTLPRHALQEQAFYWDGRWLLHMAFGCRTEVHGYIGLVSLFCWHYFLHCYKILPRQCDDLGGYHVTSPRFLQLCRVHGPQSANHYENVGGNAAEEKQRQ